MLPACTRERSKHTFPAWIMHLCCHFLKLPSSSNFPDPLVDGVQRLSLRFTRVSIHILLSSLGERMQIKARFEVVFILKIHTVNYIFPAVGC